MAATRASLLRPLAGLLRCGKCRQLYREQLRLSGNPDRIKDPHTPDHVRKWNAKWLLSDDRLAICYRETMLEFGIPRVEDIRRLPLDERREVHWAINRRLKARYEASLRVTEFSLESFSDREILPEIPSHGSESAAPRVSFGSPVPASAPEPGIQSLTPFLHDPAPLLLDLDDEPESLEECRSIAREFGLDSDA